MKNELLNNQNLVNESVLDLLTKTLSEKGDLESSTLKMLDKIKDKVNLNELLAKSILSGNLATAKTIIEKMNIDINNQINISPFLLQQNLDSSANYNNISIPLNILIAISGNNEIFDFLISKGLNIKATGHIGISNKKRNSIISNIFGAAAYYGRIDFLKHLINMDYKGKKGILSEININHRSIEKKINNSKTGQIIKEMTGLTPIMLACINDDNHEKSFETFYFLQDFSDINQKDFEGNNILHLATKSNNLKLVKFLVSIKNFDFKAQNSNGETAFYFSLNLGFSKISDFYHSLEKSEETIQQNFYSLFEEDDLLNQNKNKKKGKKQKKKVEDEFLGISNFEKATIKPGITSKEEEINKISDQKDKIKEKTNTDDEIDKAFDANNDDASDYIEEQQYSSLLMKNKFKQENKDEKEKVGGYSNHSNYEYNNENYSNYNNNYNENYEKNYDYDNNYDNSKNYKKNYKPNYQLNSESGGYYNNYYNNKKYVNNNLTQSNQYKTNYWGKGAEYNQNQNSSRFGNYNKNYKNTYYQSNRESNYKEEKGVKKYASNNDYNSIYPSEKKADEILKKFQDNEKTNDSNTSFQHSYQQSHRSNTKSNKFVEEKEKDPAVFINLENDKPLDSQVEKNKTNQDFEENKNTQDIPDDKVHHISTPSDNDNNKQNITNSERNDKRELNEEEVQDCENIEGIKLLNEKDLMNNSEYLENLIVSFYVFDYFLKYRSIQIKF